MRRALLVLAAAGALLAANRLAAPLRPVPEASLKPPAWIPLLGPLRPVLADLFRLRFEATRSQEAIHGQLQEAWTVLMLAPERADAFVAFSNWFLFDAPRLAATPAEREACLRAGFQILRTGRSLHPRSARLLFGEAVALDHFARHAPERIVSADLPPGETPRGRALDLFEQAFARTPPDDPDRLFLRFSFAFCVQSLLADGTTPPDVRARARAAAERLLREPDLDAESRDALASALAEPSR